MKRLFVMVSLVISLMYVTSSFSEVAVWVDYNDNGSEISNLRNPHGGVEPNKVFTTICIQYWQPNGSGGLTGPVHEPGPFVQWAHDNGAKALLTVFNAIGGGVWDWGLATNSFSGSTAGVFADALIDEANKYSLDGIDLDLEGNDKPSDDHRTEFNDFIDVLSDKIKANTGTCKILTVCTFGDPIDQAGSHVPNTTWWGDWVGKVANIHTMLYAEGGDQGCPGIGPDANDNSYWYSTQQKIGKDAGYKTSTVSMGVPTFDIDNGAAWQNDVMTHLNQIYDIKASICLWDLQLANSNWQSSSQIWQKLQAIHDQLSSYTLELTVSSGGTVTKNPDQSSYTPGTQVTLTANPNSGNTFTGWGGDLSGSQSPITITMDDYKKVTASFSGGDEFNMLAGGDWDTCADEYGSIVTFASANGEIAASWTLAQQPDENTDVWLDLFVTAEGDYSPLTSVKITYTSGDPLIIALTQDPISEEGEGYMYELPEASSPSTMTLTVDDNTFHQPSWVTSPTPLDLSKVSGFDFMPGVEGSLTSSQNGTFTISELMLYGVNFGTPVITPNTAHTVKGIDARITGAGLVISGIHDHGVVTLYDIAGRILLKRDFVKGMGDRSQVFPLKGIAIQTAFIRIETNSERVTKKLPLSCWLQ